jgi:hypothetical protein
LSLSKKAKSPRQNSNKQPAQVDTSDDEEEEEEDFTFVDTPCPSRHRSKKMTRPVKLVGRQTAALLSSEISRGPWPVMTKLQTHNKRKRSVCNIEICQPNTGSWVQARPSPIKKPTTEKNVESEILDQENDYIVIDDDGEPEQERQEEADTEMEMVQSSDSGRIDDGNEEGFTVLNHDHHDVPRSPTSSVDTLEALEADLPPDERFDLDRARVTRVLRLYESWREPQPAVAETPSTSTSSSFLSFGSPSTPASSSSSYYSFVDLEGKQASEMEKDFSFFS